MAHPASSSGDTYILPALPHRNAVRSSRPVPDAGPAPGVASAAVDAPPPANGHVVPSKLFKSFFAAGFECSTFFRRPDYRLDLIESTAHDKFAELDYLRLRSEGIQVAREGVRWHLVETTAGKYDFSSVLPVLRGACATGTQVIWDLCHFGWPDDLELFGPEFIPRLVQYGVAFVEWLHRETDEPAFIVPINEISFFSWAAGDEGSMYPFVIGRGAELKRKLIRGTIETIKAIRSVAPATRFVQVDPLIHVVASAKHPEEIPDAEAYRLSQFQAWDMLAGHLCPELGGGEGFLDIVGVNFYPQNQWVYNLKQTKRIRKFQPLSRRHPLYRPLSQMLKEVYKRYGRPMLIAETGAENRVRAGWLRYVCEECRRAMSGGLPLHAICLYPILNHPGWADDRHCHNGLWDYSDAVGNREIYRPLAAELRQWRRVFEPSIESITMRRPRRARTRNAGQR